MMMMMMMMMMIRVHLTHSQFEAEQKLEDTVNNKTRLFYQLT